jgi:outer membrane protein assembly factor BamB
MSWTRSCCRYLGIAVALLLPVLVHADDWPQWRGPQRTGLSAEKGLLKSWPKDGPKLLWKAKQLGGSYATPTVAGGKVYGMGFRGNNEVVWALNESTGKELWSVPIGQANRGIGYGEGPRCSPTVDGNRLYVLGVSGDLVCLDAANGRAVWRKNLAKDFKGRVMSGWGYSESPLIDGNKVIATPGGKEATLVALNKATGALLWKASVPEGDGAGYASVIAADVDGQRQYVQFLGGGVVGVDANNGKFLWRYNKPHNGTANCSTALFKDNCVFAASGYGTGGGMVKLTRNGDKTSAEEAYFTKKMKNHHGGMVLVDGYIYGADENVLTCIDFKTGEVKWQSRNPGKGAIAYADGCLYFRNEGGPIYLVEAYPDEYRELAKFDQPDQSGKNTWPHPVIANGKLFILDQDTLLCYDVKQR